MRKIVLILSLLLLSMAMTLPAAAVSKDEFVGTYITSLGDNWDQGIAASDILVNASDFIIAGSANACDTYCSNGILAQLDFTGAVSWSTMFGEEDISKTEKLYLSTVAGDDAGNLYAAGAQGNHYESDWDLFIVKVSGGRPVWQWTLNHESANAQYPYDIAVNNDGTVGVLAQNIHSWCSGPCECASRAIYLYTLDAGTGEIKAEKVLGYSGHARFVSDGFIVADARDVWIGGVLRSLLVLKKYDRAGELVWSQSYPSYRETEEGETHYINLPNIMTWGEFDNGYVVALAGNSYDFKGLIFQIDLQGKLNWMNIFDIYGQLDRNASPAGLLVYSDGSCLLSTTSGFTSVDNVLTNFSQTGNLNWSRALTSPNSLTIIAEKPGGGFLGAGKPTTFIVRRLMAGLFPDQIPPGDFCTVAGLVFTAHSPTVTPVIASEGTGEARGGCTFSDAVLTQVDYYMPDETMSRRDYCGYAPMITPVLNVILFSQD